jgi:hypothetical protein
VNNEPGAIRVKYEKIPERVGLSTIANRRGIAHIDLPRRVGVSEGRIFSLQGGAFQISCGDLMASTLSLTRSFSTAVLHQVTLVCLACLISLEQQEASAGVLVQLGFNDITSSSISTVQHDTGNRLVYDATFADWDRAGFNAAHALQISGAVHGGLGDYALMIYGDNIATQKTGFAANDLGTTYYVSYEMGPTVYSDPGQMTQAGDTFRVNLLRADNSVLATNDVSPGAWTGAQTFALQYFSYVGDGSGPVKMQLLSANTLTRFAGAIDKVAIWDSVPTASTVPEPSTLVISAAGIVGAGMHRWRSRKKLPPTTN